MTRVRIVDEPEACCHGVSWDDWCFECQAEDEATCDDCGYPWLACLCPPSDAGPHEDRQQAQAESIAIHRRGRGLEIVRDPLGRVA